jgi:hypothetical protein
MIVFFHSLSWYTSNSMLASFFVKLLIFHLTFGVKLLSGKFLNSNCMLFKVIIFSFKKFVAIKLAACAANSKSKKGFEIILL